MPIFTMNILTIDDPDFEPSIQTKRLWRYVRKQPWIAGRQEFPGLFQVTSFERDLSMFVLALVLECWGLFMLVSVGNIPLLYRVALIVTAIFIDLVLALAYHAPVGKICEFSTRRAVAMLTNPATLQMVQQRLKRDTQRQRLLRIPAGLGVVVWACFKIFVYYSLQARFDTLVISVLVSYVVVAFIHLYFTGYALFGLYAHFWSFRRDRNRFLNGLSGRVVWYRCDPINTKVFLLPVCLPVDETPIEGSPRRREIAIERGLPREVKEEANEDVKKPESAATDKHEPDYSLFTWGLFTDQQLTSMVGLQQTEHAKDEVAANGVKHQWRILNENLALRVEPRKPREQK